MNTRVYDLKTEYEAGMDAAADVLRQGGLVAFPTETVYGLGADACNGAAVSRIFAAKGRPGDNPLIVHVCAAGQAGEIAQITPLAAKLMDAFWPGPFTAVLPSRGVVCREVTAGLGTVGVRMPAAGSARELIRRSGRLIAAPSANLSGRPSPTEAGHVLADFDGVVPIILDGGPADCGVESTVCDLTGEVPIILRPGGVTAEMIRQAAGEVQVARAVLEGLGKDEHAASPGMKYKHYAPKAKVWVVDGDSPNTIAKKLKAMYDSMQDEKCVILCADCRAGEYPGRNVMSIGADRAAIARNLFGALREADRQEYANVFFEAVSPDGMGLAIMNRIIRAAGFHIV